ncbi:hypothetical protein RZS08_57290, partial [Arthrospira platensis SPKY1]|nr:hypothetical protein [Arthrospira platensis SPKY1]
LERWRGIGPAQRQPGQPDHQQAGSGLPGEPHAARHHCREQAVAEQCRLAQRMHAVLDEAAAAGEGEQPAAVGVIGAAQGVVIIIDDVAAGVGKEREQHG